MKNQNRLFHNKLTIIGILFILLCAGCKKDGSENPNTWTTYKADEKSTSYSPLDQINVSNVNQLQNAWTFQTNDVPQGDQAVSSQSNPIIIDGVMYANSAKQSVYAINAQTGEQIWAFKALAEGEPSAASSTADKKLWAFDKKTGNLVWETILPAPNNANVCSYAVGGKQYLALSVGGTAENPGGSIMAFALP